MDLLNPRGQFELLVIDNIPRVRFPAVGLLQKSPIVCGGWDWNVHGISQDCIVIGQPEKKIKMLERRVRAVSVVLHQTTLWIVGGYGNSNVNPKSTELRTKLTCTDQTSGGSWVHHLKIEFSKIFQKPELRNRPNFELPEL